MALEAVAVCPACRSTSFSHKLSCNDYSFSRETFALRECNHCGLLITSPRPTPDRIAEYYSAPGYIPHTGNSFGLLSFIYKTARKHALNAKLKIITQHHRKGTLLDIGCGTGEFLHHMHKAGWETHGIEPAESARSKALTINPGRITSSLKEAQHPHFDVITLWHVLEHLPQPDEALETIRGLLSPDGVIFVAVPNHKSYDAEHYKEYWAGFDVPRHFWHFDRQSMTTLLKNQGLVIRHILPMPLDAYYVSLLSERYMNSSPVTAYLRAFNRGWKSNQKARRSGEYSSLLYIIGR